SAASAAAAAKAETPKPPPPPAAERPVPPPAADPVSPPVTAAPPVSLPGAATTPVAPPASPPPEPAAAATPDPQVAIADPLSRYRPALEARSLASLKRLWPSLGGAQQDAIKDDFDHASRIDVQIVDPQITASGGTGTVSFIRRYEQVTVDGQKLRSQS